MLNEKLEKIIEKTKAVQLSNEKVFDGSFVKVYKEEYKLPDDRIITKQRVSKNNDKEAAIVITRTSDDKYVIVFQNRVDNIVSAEFPSGYVEPGEDIVTASIREVEEETGFTIKEAKLIDTFIPNIGTESTKIHIVYAIGAKKEKQQSLDKDEFINYYLFTFEELKYLIENNYIISGGNKLAFFHLKEILNNEKN